MNVNELQRKLIAAARANTPDDRVPYAFEKRIMALIPAVAPSDNVAVWVRGLWQAAVSCAVVALLCGANARACSIDSRDPYQYAPRAWPISSTPSSSTLERISSIISLCRGCCFQFAPASSCTDNTASSHG